MDRHARIALLQLPAFSNEDAEESLAHTLRQIDEAARSEPDFIVMPEMTYPAYFLGAARPESMREPAEVMEIFAGKAREHHVHIAAGMALESPAGGYTNGAALFGREGNVIGRYDKSFLWHFDTRWFAGGTAYPVFETDAGRIGMLVCADGRLPEIARSLTLRGAQIILDLTAWVSSARNPADLTSVQPQFLMPVRAAENGVWIAAADKVGVEADSIVYCGQSCVIDPRGQIVASLGPAEDGILIHEVPIVDAAPRILRRPELYEALTFPTESLPINRIVTEPLVLRNEDRRVATVQITMPPDGAAFLALARTQVERLALHDATIVVFPATPSRLRRAYAHDDVLQGMCKLAADTNICVAFTVSEPDAGGFRTMYLVGPRGVIARHRQTHKPPGERFATMPLGDAPSPVVTTPAGHVGVMVAAEGFVPEVARSLMLRGAELILWASDDPGGNMLPLARARAEENALYVACAAAPTATGATAIVDPAGNVLAAALEGRELAVSATINRALTHRKDKAPGTNVVRDRRPETYGIITAPERARATVI